MPTTSTSVRAETMRYTERPMRPKPLMPMRVVIVAGVYPPARRSAPRQGRRRLRQTGEAPAASQGLLTRLFPRDRTLVHAGGLLEIAGSIAEVRVSAGA